MQECFIVLEPSNHLFKVAERAAARGLHVIVFHNMPLGASGEYRKGLEAIGEAHRIESWFDEAAALAQIEAVLDGRLLRGTYAGFESVLMIEADLRARYGLPTHGRELLGKLFNKRWVRTRLREQGLSALRDFDPRALLADSHWPLGERAGYLKPISGTGSIHVSRCAGLDDVRAGLAQWDADAIAFRDIQRPHLRRGGGLFLEEEAEGELMSLEGWVYEGRYHVLGLTSRTVLARDPSIEMGATFPYEHRLRERIEEKIGAIHCALGLVHGATHTELMVGPDGGIELVELNVRFGGADLLLLINFALDQSAGEVLVDLGCGIEPEPVVRGQGGYAVMQQLLAPAGTTRLDAISLDPQLVIENKMLKPAGSAIASTDHQHDHVGAFIVLGDSYASSLEKARQVRATAAINGRSIAADPNNIVVLR